MMTMFFQKDSFPDGTRHVTGWQTASKSNTEQYAKFFWGMISKGIYLPCSQFEALFFSITHTEEHIQTTITAAKTVLADLNTTS
jgi:glutamate-1-semialdehyde 2,1-aminomutase